MSTEELREKYESLAPFLDERQRRLWAAVEALAIGRGGVARLSEATGLSRKTIEAGIDELRTQRDCSESVPGLPKVLPTPTGARPTRRPAAYQRDRIRLPGGGRKPVEVKDPAILIALEQLIEDDVAGDPMREAKWVRASLRRLSEQLAAKGHRAAKGTVGRLLKRMGYSMKCNRRRQAHSKDPERDEQFRYIASQKARFLAAGLPVISVDTKKKELIGNFRNPGQAWCREAEEVDEHDFPGGAECRAVPFGVYDVARNRGYVVVGVSNNTPLFAVASIAGWWREEGGLAYPTAKELLILADGGGGTGSRARAWKLHLQTLLCDAFGLEVSVCHYPPGCSKWNPVEYRLFSQISRNWAGRPLRTLDIMLGYIRGTTTTTGLVVTARLDEQVYPKGEKVGRKEMVGLQVRRHETCPAWNYTISPRRA